MTLHGNPKSIEDYMALPWRTIITDDPDGGVVLKVYPLNDFAVYGDTKEEVEAEWKDAFRSHLMGYLNCGKAIPFVRIIPPLYSDTRTYLPDDTESGSHLAIA